MDFSIRVDADATDSVASWLGETGSAQGVPADPLWRLDLCVTEVLANVVQHGGAGIASSPIGLHLELRRSAGGGEAVVTVSDTGIAFDPLSVPARPRPRTLAEAEPGGQGLPLLRRFSDALDYRYSEGRNHLTIHVRWTEGGEGAL